MPSGTAIAGSDFMGSSMKKPAAARAGRAGVFAIFGLAARMSAEHARWVPREFSMSVIQPK